MDEINCCELISLVSRSAGFSVVGQKCHEVAGKSMVISLMRFDTND